MAKSHAHHVSIKPRVYRITCFRGAAKNTFYLKKIGVTHVLNTAQGTRSGCVDVDKDYYKPFGISYKVKATRVKFGTT